MIKGIGTDIIEIDRIKEAVKKQSFLDKIFTDKNKNIVNFALKNSKCPVTTNILNIISENEEIKHYVYARTPHLK